MHTCAFKTGVYSFIFFIFLGGFVTIILYFVIYSENQNTKILLSAFSVFSLVIAFIWSAINQKEWSPSKFPEQIFDKQKKRMYENFGFDENELTEISKELSETKRHLRRLEAEKS